MNFKMEICNSVSCTSPDEFRGGKEAEKKSLVSYSDPIFIEVIARGRGRIGVNS